MSTWCSNGLDASKFIDPKVELNLVVDSMLKKEVEKGKSQQ